MCHCEVLGLYFILYRVEEHWRIVRKDFLYAHAGGSVENGLERDKA